MGGRYIATVFWFALKEGDIRTTKLHLALESEVVSKGVESEATFV